jgi:hypothetical protein
MSLSNKGLVEKWGPLLEHSSFNPITDAHKKSVTATILENTERALMEDRSGASMTSLLTEQPTNFAGTGGFGSSAEAPQAGYDPVLISLVRDGAGTNFAEMAFSIEKVTVAAKSRALKAEYTTELAQDLKAVHGLDAETELANILSSEILVEINREVVRTIYNTAVTGAANTSGPGVFDMDVDANGRWSVEKFKGLMFQIEQEANAIAKATRRGKGNIVICSSDVASALQMAGVLDYTPALNSNALNVDDTGNTFAGVLNGRFRVYIDPYAGGNYVVVGYKGSSAFDAGLFYCPYVPLQMYRAVGEDSFQPKIGFKTRYGMVHSRGLLLRPLLLFVGLQFLAFHYSDVPNAQ